MALSLVSYAARAVAKALIYQLPNECKRCPACDSPRLFDLDMIRFRRSRSLGFVTGCRGCGLVFTNPLPSEADLAQFYSPAGEWGQTHTRAAASPAPARKRRGRGKWLRQFDAIRDNLCVEAPPPGARVFDYGCGAGQDLDVLQDCGWETWGLETAVDDAFTRHRRLHAVPDEPTFSVAIVNHVLEHLAEFHSGCCADWPAHAASADMCWSGCRVSTRFPIHRDYPYRHQRPGARDGVHAGMPRGIARARRLRLARARRRAGPQTRRRFGCACSQSARMAFSRFPASPARMASQAVQTYYEGVDERPMLTRLGLFRLAARCGLVP